LSGEGLTYDVYEVYEKLTAAEVYGLVLTDLGKQNSNIVVLTADLQKSTKIGQFFKVHPDRAFNCGVAEQNMFSVAAGLALTGKLPFVSTFSAFVAMRACEQVRTDIAYPNLTVRIVGTHSGLSMGQGGATHNSTEDIAILRSMANMTVIVPADGIETGKVIQASLAYPGPLYVRVGRGFEPPVYDDDRYHYEIGKAIPMNEGSDYTAIVCGICVLSAVEAAEILEEDEHISLRVINMHTIKPVDREAVIRAARETKGIVTVEEHNVIGGLGSAVAEVLAEEGIATKFTRVGIPDTYSDIGYPEELYARYRLDTDGIVDAVLTLDGRNDR
jgi:transketolase